MLSIFLVLTVYSLPCFARVCWHSYWLIFEPPYLLYAHFYEPPTHPYCSEQVWAVFRCPR